MGEGEGVAGLEVVLDVLLVDLGLDFVGDEDHDDVGLLRRVVHAHDLEAGLLGLLGGRGALAQANADVNAGVQKVQRVGVALRAVADDGDLLALDDARVHVLLVVDVDGHVLLLCLWGRMCRLTAEKIGGWCRFGAGY